MSESTNLQSWPEGITAARIPANNNIRLLQAIKINPVLSATTTAQPGAPEEGDVYIIPTAATGGQWGAFTEGDVAIFYEATWTAYTPVDGLRKFVIDEGEDWQFIGGSTGSWAAAGGGGGGSPGGSDTQVQFNDGGSFGGDAGLVYNKTTDTLTLVNATYTGLVLTAASATGSAGLRVPHGAAPSAPVDGDVWTTSAGGMYVRINGVTVGPLAASGGGGLTGFTSALNTASPNNTNNVSSLTASGGTTNQIAALVSKGDGATTAQIPDGTTTAGNVRGAYATDWQKLRTTDATRVASGIGATIAGGRNNGASGTDSAVGGGSGNRSNGTCGTVSGGETNLASNNYGSVGGGQGNTAGGVGSRIGGGATNTTSTQYNTIGGGSGNTTTAVAAGYSTVAGGLNNNADGDYSWIAGGYYGTARTLLGSGTRSSGRFAATGDAQSQWFQGRVQTTNATQTVLTFDAAAAGANNQVILPNNSCYMVKGTVIARENATGDSSAWEFTAFIKRGANAAATAMVAAATIGTPIQDVGAAAWVLTIDADTTQGGLRVRVTGEASHTIRWGLDVYSCNEVQG